MRALGLLAFLIYAGCGFIGANPFGELTVADVAPWQDVGPVTICDEHARLGVPALGAAGLCTPTPGATPTCEVDTQCASRETCVCGRCRIPVCDSLEECQNGQVCTFSDRRCDRSCTIDADCMNDERCVAGRNVCRGTCTSNASCQHGERCDTTSALCVVDACSTNGDCRGLSCELQRVPTALAEPSPLIDGDQVILYFERDDPGAAPAIWRATSSDGSHFVCDPSTALLDGASPSVAMAAPGDLRMLFASSGDVFAATSADGVHFTAGATAVLSGVGQPSLLIDADESWIAYGQKGDDLVRSTSGDGRAFDATTPVLTAAQVTNPTSWRGVTTLQSPFAAQLTGLDGHVYTRLWFAAFGQENGPSMEFGMPQAAPPDFSIGIASSPDGVTFAPYPYDPVFDRLSDFVTPLSEQAPAVITFGGRQLLYYVRGPAVPAGDLSTTQNFGLASNPESP